jgi:hypothetical protein
MWIVSPSEDWGRCVAITSLRSIDAAFRSETRDSVWRAAAAHDLGIVVPCRRSRAGIASWSLPTYEAYAVVRYHGRSNQFR